ncbi:MAG: hypothetical protein IH897_13045, partial [Planctomycetes bacterium]|nr:hypothetical protein [Planctomycetota bacterium]
MFTAIGVGFLGSAAIVLADDAVNHQAWSDRPFELGVSGSSIEHIFDFPRIYCYAGTLGSLVTDGTDDYILSNNHVLAKENDPDNSSLDPDGRNIIQAGLLDEGTCSLSLGDPNNIVGYLTAYVPLQFGKGKNPPENKVDAAIAVTNETVAMVASDGSIRDVGPLTGAPETANVGDQVHKSGRTTGHTFGEVAAINVTIKVKYMSGTALFVDQIEATGLCDTQFSDSGDSGSLIVTLRDGAPRAPVGLLFAGGGASTFANPIDTVLSKMGAQANLTLSMVVGGTGNVNDVTDNTEIPSCSAGGGSVTAADDSYKLPKKNTVLTVAAPGILENDTGFVGSAVVVSGPSVGVGNLTFGGDGGFTYEYIGADRNGDGSDSFVYEVTDGANFATATVTITVLSAEQQTANLIAAIGQLVDVGSLNRGQGNSLIKKLNPNGNLRARINRLGAFINHVNSLVNEGVLTKDEGQSMIKKAEDLRTSLSISAEPLNTVQSGVDLVFAESARLSDELLTAKGR